MTALEQRVKDLERKVEELSGLLSTALAIGSAEARVAPIRARSVADEVENARRMKEAVRLSLRGDRDATRRFFEAGGWTPGSGATEDHAGASACRRNGGKERRERKSA